MYNNQNSLAFIPYSHVNRQNFRMWRKSLICLVSILTLGASAHAGEPDGHAPPVKPLCLTASETREEIKAHRLIEPFAALKSAQAQYKAEALSAKLCHLGEEYLYVISLLHRDGRYVHVEMDASTGKWIEPRRAREAITKP
jgi:hypothetical protein